MIIDLLQNIVGYSNLRNQIRCSMLDNYTYDNIYIYILNADQHYIDQKIIEQKKFSKLKKLAYKNSNISNLNHLADTLEILYIGGKFDAKYSIRQEGISKLKKIRVLMCPDNKNIKDVNSLADTLTCLDCRGCD